MSNTAEYALRAMIHLEEVPGDKPTRVDDIAEALDVPRNYLSKILHALARSGFLISFRGPGGGFVFSDSTRSAPLVEIIRLFDSEESQKQCFLGRAECRDDDPCPAHAKWSDISGKIQIFLNKTTLGDLARARLPPTPPQ